MARQCAPHALKWTREILPYIFLLSSKAHAPKRTLRQLSNIIDSLLFSFTVITVAMLIVGSRSSRVRNKSTPNGAHHRQGDQREREAEGISILSG